MCPVEKRSQMQCLFLAEKHMKSDSGKNAEKMT
jgi:hypothetical protein